MAGMRSGSREADGQSSAIAASAAAEARHQPASRSGIVDAGLASETGRMNERSSEVDALASTELTTPAKSTPNATRAMATAASQASRDASVPRHDERGSGERQCRLRLQPFAHRAAEVDEQQHRERAERRVGRELRVVEPLVADGEQRRHEDRRADGTPQHGIAAIVCGEPVEGARHLARGVRAARRARSSPRLAAQALPRLRLARLMVSANLPFVMANGAQMLAALGDPTRRLIFDRISDGALPVGELAAGLPVTRPAVSQHLKVLKDVGLVLDRKVGTRRLYQTDPAGIAVLRSYLDQFWERSLAAFEATTRELERTDPDDPAG